MFNGTLLNKVIFGIFWCINDLYSVRNRSSLFCLPPKMTPKKNIPPGAKDTFILIWSDVMIDVFLQLLEEVHDNGGKKDRVQAGDLGRVSSWYSSIAVGKI